MNKEGVVEEFTHLVTFLILNSLVELEHVFAYIIPWHRNGVKLFKFTYNEENIM